MNEDNVSPEVPALSDDGVTAGTIEQFLRRKYVTRADERQRSLGLEYLTAEIGDLAREIARFVSPAALKARPVAPAARVFVQEMRLSDGRSDFYVAIKCEDREVTPHMFQERFKAEYHVALYDWLLNGGEEPCVIDFNENDWPAKHRFAAPAEPAYFPYDPNLRETYLQNAKDALTSAGIRRPAPPAAELELVGWIKPIVLHRDMRENGFAVKIWDRYTKDAVERAGLIALYRKVPPAADASGVAQDDLVGRLFNLAHQWAIQSYYKGLGRPCDIDGARSAFETEATRLHALSRYLK